MTLVDTCILLDIVQPDPSWGDWSLAQLDHAADRGPLLINPIPGCPFQPRCDWAIDECGATHPELETKEPGHTARCFRNPGIDQKTKMPAGAGVA